MTDAVRSGGRVDEEVSPDARNLPSTLTKVKPDPRTPGSAHFDDGHEEKVIAVIDRGLFNRLVISDVIAPNFKRYGSIRAWTSTDGREWRPTHKGVMIRIGSDLEAVIDALREVAK